MHRFFRLWYAQDPGEGRFFDVWIVFIIRKNGPDSSLAKLPKRLFAQSSSTECAVTLPYALLPGAVLWRYRRRGCFISRPRSIINTF